MAKQSSILARSKDAENRVQRYLWPGTLRCWKELWDVGFLGNDGTWDWVGEVKSRKTKTLAEAYRILVAAFEQVRGVAPDGAEPFAVLTYPGADIEKAFVMWHERHPLFAWHSHAGTLVIARLKDFGEIVRSSCVRTWTGTSTTEEPPDADA